MFLNIRHCLKTFNFFIKNTRLGKQEAQGPHRLSEHYGKRKTEVSPVLKMLNNYIMIIQVPTYPLGMMI